MKKTLTPPATPSTAFAHLDYEITQVHYSLIHF